MLNVGDRVVCVDDSIQANMANEIMRDFQVWVNKGKKYTIREILDNDGIVVGILLEEIHNMPIYFRLIRKMQEPAFGAFRFKKLEPAMSEEEADEFADKILKELEISI